MKLYSAMSSAPHIKYANALRNGAYLNGRETATLRIQKALEESSIGYTKEEAYRILTMGTDKEKVQLSEYFYAASGIYKTLIVRASTLPLYTWHSIPHLFNYDPEQMKKDKKFAQALTFSHVLIDRSSLKEDMIRIVNLLFRRGSYFGIWRDGGSKYFIQDLPQAYCRTRYKNLKNQYIIEFDLDYFKKILADKGQTKAEALKLLLSQFPKEFTQAWNQYASGKVKNNWFTIDETISVCGVGIDGAPLFLNTIPGIISLIKQSDTEAKRDANELQKLLINRLPMTKDGDLIFGFEEAAEIHSALAQMMQANDTIDVITSFGEMRIEDVQTKTGADNDKLAKVERGLYNDAGVAQAFVSPKDNAGLEDARKAFENTIFSALIDITNCIDIFLQSKTPKNKTGYFSYKLMPITVTNQKEKVEEYKGLATLGYPKELVAVAAGMTQSQFISSTFVENELYKLQEIMYPASTSYTGGLNAETGGRPPSEAGSKTQKTIENTK